MKMAGFRKNHENALSEFHNFRDKVTCCVSLDDVKMKATSLKCKNEWFNYNKKLLSSALDRTISEIYVGMDLENKLTKLHELDKENNGKAWRPQTGKPDISSIEGSHLHKEKKSLKKSLLQMKNKSAILQSEISDFRNQIKEQIIQIKESAENDLKENEETKPEETLTDTEDIL